MIRTLFSTVGAALLLAAVPAAAQERSADAQQPPQQPPIQARPGGPENNPRTDQTVDVTKGTRLVLSNNAGEVVVRSWDREQVRVQATHSERDRIDIQNAENTLRVRARTAHGPASLVDYQITVPRWMAVNLSGTYLESTIDGTTAEVTVETVHGNVHVAGGSGNIVVRSVEGTITVEKATGKVQATTVNEGIRLSNVSGDMSAETTNGDIVIENAQTTSLDASTVNGDVTFNGTIKDGGAYRLTTHGGDIRVGLGGAPNATVFVRTFQGDFGADFPIQLPEGQSARSGSKRFNFTLGNGSARIELQSFSGDIVIARKSITTSDEARRIRRGQPPQPPQPPQGPEPPKPAKPPKPPKEKGELAFEHEFKSDKDFAFEHDFKFDQNFAVNTSVEFSEAYSHAFAEQFADAFTGLDDFDIDLGPVFEWATPAPDPHPAPEPHKMPRPHHQ